MKNYFSGGHVAAGCLFLICCLLAVLLYGGKTKERVTMKVTIEFAQNNLFVDTINNTPVIPLGYDIFLTGRITNETATELTIEDPNTSQLLLGHSIHSDDGNESTFMFTPSMMDSTGEITSPPTNDVKLKPGESIDIPIPLYKHMMDKCFVPGTLQLSISYNDTKSLPCTFMIKFTEESVEKLLTILNDVKQDMWIAMVGCATQD